MKLLMAAFVLFSLQVFGQETTPKNNFNINSAIRLPGEDYQKAFQRYRNGIKASRSLLPATSAVGEAVSYAKLDYKSASTVLSPQDAVAVFQKGRDTRFLTTPAQPLFPRRSSWLYPDDGCWARAALFSENMETWNYPRAFKIFAFGNLDVKTANSSQGHVSWWYHVVPGAVVNGHVTVFDPAIEPKNPVTLEEWLLKMVPDLASVRVSICSPKTYTPSSDCQAPLDTEENRAVADQTNYLYAEWQRLLSLKRDPTKELGDSPPW